MSRRGTRRQLARGKKSLAGEGEKRPFRMDAGEAEHAEERSRLAGPDPEPTEPCRQAGQTGQEQKGWPSPSWPPRHDATAAARTPGCPGPMSDLRCWHSRPALADHRLDQHSWWQAMYDTMGVPADVQGARDGLMHKRRLANSNDQRFGSPQPAGSSTSLPGKVVLEPASPLSLYLFCVCV